MKRLKLAAQAFKPSNLKQGLDAARNPPNQAEIDAAVAKLPPEQRAQYERDVAASVEGVRQAQAARERNEQAFRVLDGPAGLALYGPGIAELGTSAELDALGREQGPLALARHMREAQKGQFKQTFRRTEPPGIDDPQQRARHAAHERATRDAARAPYRSPHAVGVEIARLATRGKTQVQDVLAYLNGSGLATDRIFGVYRVPDRISQTVTPHSEKGRLVEWDIVHGPGASRVGARPLVATSFGAKEHWVAKRVGEPAVLDEDLALAFVLGAGIGPEQCAGLARVSEFRTLAGDGGGDTSSAGPIRTLVRGIVAFHPADGSGTHERMRAGAPLHLGPAAGVHLEVLNWGALAAAVHPRMNHPPPVPSPFPYLPATPDELICAYLEVVGVQPGDCYSVQATVHRARPLEQHGWLMTTNIGPKQPCADGKPRMRAHGGQHVVLAYRDRPEYAEGRQRWAAYQRDVLQAHFERGLGLRPPVQDPDEYSDLPRLLRPAIRTAEFVARLHPDNWFDDWGVEELNPHRYCWPPVK